MRRTVSPALGTGPGKGRRATYCLMNVATLRCRWAFACMAPGWFPGSYLQGGWCVPARTRRASFVCRRGAGHKPHAPYGLHNPRDAGPILPAGHPGSILPAHTDKPGGRRDVVHSRAELWTTTDNWRAATTGNCRATRGQPRRNGSAGRHRTVRKSVAPQGVRRGGAESRGRLGWPAAARRTPGRGCGSAGGDGPAVGVTGDGAVPVGVSRDLHGFPFVSTDPPGGDPFTTRMESPAGFSVAENWSARVPTGGVAGRPPRRRPGRRCGAECGLHQLVRTRAGRPRRSKPGR